MKYITLLVIIAFTLASCKKDDITTPETVKKYGYICPFADSTRAAFWQQYGYSVDVLLLLPSENQTLGANGVWDSVDSLLIENIQISTPEDSSSIQDCNCITKVPAYRQFEGYDTFYVTVKTLIKDGVSIGTWYTHTAKVATDQCSPVML